MVTATLVETVNTSVTVVQCHFITGSNALGCMVVLVSESTSIFFILERNNPCKVEALNTTDPMSSFYAVYAYDIESDGTSGTLPIPGQLIRTSSENFTSTCLSSVPTGDSVLIVNFDDCNQVQNVAKLWKPRRKLFCIYSAFCGTVNIVC